MAGYTDISFDFQTLISILSQATQAAKDEIATISGLQNNVAIGDMFNMQMQMNKLSQMTEMLTSVLSASNASIMSMARNMKG
jgi:aerobic-type carbon monoxide dehydrogenase small subunit (CoxS/CutS family)